MLIRLCTQIPTILVLTIFASLANSLTCPMPEQIMDSKTQGWIVYASNATNQFDEFAFTSVTVLDNNSSSYKIKCTYKYKNATGNSIPLVTATFTSPSTQDNIFEPDLNLWNSIGANYYACSTSIEACTIEIKPKSTTFWNWFFES